MIYKYRIYYISNKNYINATINFLNNNNNKNERLRGNDERLNA